MIFRARQFEFRFPRPALVMGIVNVTPDSFSDGGQFHDANAAITHALKLVQQGAEILDIGGESTRPGAAPVSEQEELDRVIPVIARLATQTQVPLSIDTMKTGVAREAIMAGASIVNDIGANRADDSIWRLVAETKAGYVAMHMQGLPQTMQAHPVYDDVVREVAEFFQSRMQRLSTLGVAAEQVVFDVGIGFGKTLEHNLQLLAGMRHFKTLERPVLLGVSRKSFIGALTGTNVTERLPGSLACTCLALEAGVQIIRTHDVAETVQAVQVAEAILERQK